MKDDILKILRKKNQAKDWNDISNKFNTSGHKIKSIGKVNNESVYEFFDTYTENLTLNNNSINIITQPVESFVPFHIHDYVDINIPLIGNCVVVIENEKIKVNQEDIIFIGKKTTHTVKPIDKAGVVVSIALRDSAFSLNDLNFLQTNDNGLNISNLLFSLLSNEEYGEGRYSLFEIHHDTKIVNLVYDIIDEYYHSKIQSEHIIRLDMLTLFAQLIRKTYYQDIKVKNDNKQKTNLLSLLLYIEKNYSNITLQKMAQHFGFNSNYLSDYLKKETGLPFIKLVHLQRVNIAAEYLTYTKAPIEKISNKVGYENPSYFYKIFKQYFGVSPAKYRKRYKF